MKRQTATAAAAASRHRAKLCDSVNGESPDLNAKCTKASLADAKYLSGKLCSNDFEAALLERSDAQIWPINEALRLSQRNRAGDTKKVAALALSAHTRGRARRDSLRQLSLESGTAVLPTASDHKYGK